MWVDWDVNITLPMLGSISWLYHCAWLYTGKENLTSLYKYIFLVYFCVCISAFMCFVWICLDVCAGTRGCIYMRPDINARFFFWDRFFLLDLELGNSARQTHHQAPGILAFTVLRYKCTLPTCGFLGRDWRSELASKCLCTSLYWLSHFSRPLNRISFPFGL